jgi:hypothetical protein
MNRDCRHHTVRRDVRVGLSARLAEAEAHKGHQEDHSRRGRSLRGIEEAAHFHRRVHVNKLLRLFATGHPASVDRTDLVIEVGSDRADLKRQRSALVDRRGTEGLIYENRIHELASDSLRLCLRVAAGPLDVETTKHFGQHGKVDSTNLQVANFFEHVQCCSPVRVDRVGTQVRLQRQILVDVVPNESSLRKGDLKWRGDEL